MGNDGICWDMFSIPWLMIGNKKIGQPMQTDQEHSDSCSSAAGYDGDYEHAKYANKIELM